MRKFLFLPIVLMLSGCGTLLSSSDDSIAVKLQDNQLLMLLLNAYTGGSGGAVLGGLGGGKPDIDGTFAYICGDDISIGEINARGGMSWRDSVCALSGA